MSEFSHIVIYYLEHIVQRAGPGFEEMRAEIEAAIDERMLEERLRALEAKIDQPDGRQRR